MLRKLRYQTPLIFLATLALQACGTIKSTQSIENRIAIKNGSNASYCEELPHVYSGVGYNLCVLHSKPNPVIADGSTMLDLMLLDTALSAIADTILLPYTVIKQLDSGNMTVN